MWKIIKCNHLIQVMNIAIVSVYSKPSDAEKGNTEIRPATYDSTGEDK